MTGYKKILVAVDLSPEAKPVVARARELGAHYGAALSLIHVVDPIITTGDYELHPELPLEVEHTLVERARGYIGSLAKDMGIADAEQVVAIGSVKHEILAYAKEHGCDLIVIGTHGRHGIAVLLGSTANAIMHGTECDVMCVRVGDHRTAQK
jgi:universal stress protein A